MEAFKVTNQLLEKWIFIILPLLMCGGITFSRYLGDFTVLTPFLFMILTFISSFSADWRKFSGLFRRPWLYIVVLIVNHLIIPFITLFVVQKVFSNDSELFIGVTLAMMLPIGVTSIFWVGFVNGNVTMALSMVSLNTVLSPLIIPAIFYLMLNSVVHIESQSLVLSLLKLVLIPSILGMIVGEWNRRRKPSPLFHYSTSLINKVSLYLVVLFNAASISSEMDMVNEKIVWLITLTFCFMVLGYLINFGVGILFTKDLETQISIAYSGGIRNYTVGVVIATTFFSHLVAFPVLLAMLLQHPTAMLFNLIFTRMKRRRLLGLSKGVTIDTRI